MAAGTRWALRCGVVGLLTALLGPGCLDQADQRCNGALCPVDFVCVGGQVCVDPVQLAVCDGKAPLDACTATGIADGVCVRDPAGGADAPLLCIAAGCGNGVVEPLAGEVCDDHNRVDTDGCRADCRSDNTCGNGQTDVGIGEGCDCGDNPAALPPGCTTINSDAPAAQCRLDCAPAGCGDGQVVGFEDCEPGVALALGCPDLGYYDGTLACLATCRFDVSACTGRCGDGVVQGAESCERDPLDVGDATCADFGFYRGELGCTALCGFDLSTCEGTCGDGTLEVGQGESCEPDPLDLGGRSCAAFGYYGGELGCNGSCAFDLGACVGTCGDAIVDEVEQCDGAPPDQGCGALGGLYDRPACNLGCNADLRACPELALEAIAPAKTGNVYYWWTAPDDDSRWGIDQSSLAVYELDAVGLTVHHPALVGAVGDLAVLSSTDVYAVDCFGNLQQWDGAAWMLRRAGTAPCNFIGNLIVAASDDIYLADGDGVTHFDGTAWTPTTVTASQLVDLASCGGTEWALEYGNRLFRHDGPTWTAITVPFGGWRLACDDDDRYMWIVGELPGYTTTLRVDTATSIVESIALPRVDFLYAITGLGGDRMLAAIGYNADFVWTGLRWGQLSARHYVTPGLIAAGRATGSFDASRVVEFIDTTGRVTLADMLVVDHGTPSSVAITDAALWEVDGTELRQRGELVATVPAGSQVWATGDDLAFVATGSQLRQCTTAGCGPAAGIAPAVTGVQQIAVVSASEAYIVSQAGTLWRWNGATWTNLLTSATVGATPIAVVAPDRVLAVSGVNIIERNGGGFVQVYNGNRTLVGIGGRWPDAFYAVGDDGTIVRRDPVTASWTLEPQAVTTTRLTQVALANERVFVLGDNDTVLQLDAHGWMAADLRRAAAGITALRGTTSGSLWVQSLQGHIELVLADE